MPSYNLAIACLIIVPLLMQLKGARPAGLFVGVAVVYFGFAGFGYINTLLTLHWSKDGWSSAHTSYFVINGWSEAYKYGIVFGLFGLVTWVQTKYAAMKYPRMTKLFFWLFHLLLIGTNHIWKVFTIFLPMPKRYVDYDEYYAAVNLASTWLTMLLVFCLVGLVFLLLLSIFQNWVGNRKV